MQGQRGLYTNSSEYNAQDFMISQMLGRIATAEPVRVVAVSGSGSQTTSNVRCAPSASIISSGFPKSSFQENFFSSPPGDAAPSDWKENAETSASEDTAALSGERRSNWG